MDTSLIQKEIDYYLQLSNRELLLSLIEKQELEEVMYSPQGKIARSKELFQKYLDETKEIICNSYNKQDAEFTSIYECIFTLIPFVTDKIPQKIIIPFLLIIFKYGLHKLCVHE